MGMVKDFMMEYCEVKHPDDFDAQDRLFDQLCDGTVQVSVEDMQAAIRTAKKIPDPKAERRRLEAQINVTFKDG